MTSLEKAQKILEESVKKHSLAQWKSIEYTVEPWLLPSCGLMGDNRVYGYAWIVTGNWHEDDDHTKAFFREIAVRLTNEIVHEDGTRFVRVFIEVCQEE